MHHAHAQAKLRLTCASSPNRVHWTQLRAESANSRQCATNLTPSLTDLFSQIVCSHVCSAHSPMHDAWTSAPCVMSAHLRVVSYGNPRLCCLASLHLHIPIFTYTSFADISPAPGKLLGFHQAPCCHHMSQTLRLRLPVCHHKRGGCCRRQVSHPYAHDAQLPCAAHAHASVITDAVVHELHCCPSRRQGRRRS